MADVKISQLPAASTPLAGTEQIPLVQNATTKQITVSNLLTSANLGTPSAINLANATNVPMAQASGVLAVNRGGTGTATPNLVQGANVTITGTWPNQTIAAAGAAQVYPGAGVANSTGSAWGTSYTTTGTGTVLALATSPTFVTPVLGTPTSGNFSTGTFTWPTFNQNTTGTAAGLSSVLAVASGGTGTSTPSLVQGTNITITGSWPNQTIAASGAAQVYPGAGIANSTGSAWGTSYSTSGTGTVVALATGAALTNPSANQINDTNGAQILGLSPTTSAVDYLVVKNGIGVGVPLHVYANGASANIGLHIQPKGSGLVTISDGTDFNKGIRFRSSSSAASAITLLDAVSTAGRVVTLPDATTTLVGRDTTDTLTNKTIAFGSNTFSGTLAVANGGTGTATPSLVQGTNITITGTWPNQTIAAAGGGGSGTVTSVSGTGTVNGLTLTGTVTTSGSLTLGGTLDLSSPPAIGGTAAAAVSATTLTTSSTVTHNGGTANGVTYLNGSKVLTSGSALTFNGTSLNLDAAGSFTSGFSGYGLVLSKNGVGGKNAIISVADASSVLLINNSAAGWDNVATYAAGSEGMRLNSTGLGIGTSSPQSRLHVSDAVAGGQLLVTNNETNNVAKIGSLATMNYTNAEEPVLAISVEGGASENIVQIGGGPGEFNAATVIKFSTAANTTTTGGTERGRFASDGTFNIDCTAVPNGVNRRGFQVIPNTGLNDTTKILLATTTTSQRALIEFNNANGNVGSIFTQNSLTGYATSSDYRLKNTIEPMTGALAKVALLKPVTYKWNSNGSDGDGFIAHELAEVCPQAVIGAKDGVDEHGNPKYQGIDTSFLVGTLTAAIQEQQAIIESLKARLDAANL